MDGKMNKMMNRSGNIILIATMLVLWLAATFACFKTLQNEKIYRRIDGFVTTYETTVGSDRSKEVSRVKKPFKPIENESLVQWDADIYRLIAQHLYDQEHTWVGYFAFFPLFPILWKLSHLSPIGISVLNFMLFGIGFILLILASFTESIGATRPFAGSTKRPLKEKEGLIATVATMLCMPYLVIFTIPYSEALFFICISVGLYGLLKDKYYIYFIGFTLGCMTRAASSILVVAWVIADIIKALNKKESFKMFVSELTLHLLPVIVGVVGVMLFQHIRGAEHWFEFAMCQSYWGKELSLPTWPLTDWSEESKSVTQPLLFIFFIPALIWLANALFTALRTKQASLYTKADTVKMLSMLFFVGNIVLALFTQKGCMFSQARLLTCTPFFFYLMIDQLKRHHSGVEQCLITLFGIVAIVLCRKMFLKIQTLGCLITLLLTLLLFFHETMPRWLRLSSTALTLLLNVLWTAYLFNCYLSNSWIFT